MDAAASMIEKAIIANPTYAEAYNNLGHYPSIDMFLLDVISLSNASCDWKFPQ